jgi:4-hydroxymandelate oxidase
MPDIHESRRRFLKFIAASPALMAQQAHDFADLIADAKDAINVMDFEPVARKVLPPAHWGYLATGVNDDETLRANRAGFGKIQLRPRRLIDITKADLRVELFGHEYPTPIVFAPIGNQKAFYAEGEMPVARAARSRKALQILSTAANTSVEQITETVGHPIWYQLYPTQRWEVTAKLVKRAEAAGCPALALTVDTQAGRRTETFERFKKLDSRQCVACHGTTREDFYRRKPMFDGIDVKGLGTSNPAQTWEHVKRLKDLTSMKLLIKGIETREDAQLCAENGVDGIIVSNHGGRAEESGRGTIECLPEVVEGAGRIPVLIDGGFRRGTDIFKALALGAKAVCIGRPYIWGLAAFGQSGVERVLDLLTAELELIMKQCGTRSIREIGRSAVMFRG